MDRIIPIQKEILRKIIKDYTLKTPKDSLFLDFGCGLGDWLEITTPYRNVIATEINRNAAKYVMSEYNNAHFLGIIIFDGQHTPFKDGFIEIIYSPEVIEHIVDDEFFFTECYRILKKNGLIIISTPNKSIEPLDPSIHNGHVRHYTKGEIIGKFENHQFKIEKFYWRMHPFCSLIDLLLSRYGKVYMEKKSDFGHNVCTYTPKNRVTNFLLWIYSFIKPLLIFLILLEFIILRTTVEGRNMIIIARKI